MSVVPAENPFPTSDTELLRGISWRGFALVSVLFGIWALQWSWTPVRVIAAGGPAGFLSAWATVWIAMLVGGLTLFVVSVAALNAALRAGFSSAWLVVPVATVGSLAATAVSALAGSAPYGLGMGPESYVNAAFWADWAVAIAVGYLVLHRVESAREHTHRLELRRSAIEVRQMGARLTVLEAQIEPHFLFNTLSNVRRLCQQDLAGGRAMLAQLSRYLHAALPMIRRDYAPLSDEVDLAIAYLDLQKIRMGERLTVSVDVAAEHLGIAIPTMMLVTLVENAIKHGLSPLPEGGSICISSKREGESLCVSVTDTGQGFVVESGTGVGLSNIRARLAALYGDRAALRFAANQPRGVEAVVVLPWFEGPGSR